MNLRPSLAMLTDTRIMSWVRAAGPLSFLGALLLLGLAWLSASRLLLYGLFHARLDTPLPLAQLLTAGFQVDLITLSSLLLLPAVLLFGLPGHRLRWRLVLGVVTLFAAGLIYFEIATLPFMGEYGSRPNRLFFEYLVYPREVFSTLVKNCLWVMVAGTLALLALTTIVWLLCQRMRASLSDWNWSLRLLALPVVLVALLAGARLLPGQGGNGMALATFSDSHLANELALNSSHSLSYAVLSRRHEDDAAYYYGRMGWSEVLQRVRQHTRLPAREFRDPEIPTLHRQVLRQVNRRPPNLVIFVQESLGARYVGSLGGEPLTPNLDRLSREGLYFTRMYATGNRTVRGLEALVCGYPPMPAPSVLRLERAQQGFFTAAQLLSERGYATEFIYGGMGHFDNMAEFFTRNGFERVIDQDDFRQPAFVGTWGVSDEDLAERANAEFRAHGDQPFFALMLSTSNHAPFEFPPGRVTPREQPLNTRYNAVQYADYALGRFFELARREDYYRNTIFVVVADHDARVQDDELVPVEHFHIPALVLGPGVPKREHAQIASQIDLLPTVLGLMQLETEHPMIGRDLLSLPPGEPGRALMQYGLANAFRVGDRMVVFHPGRVARHFRVEGDELAEAGVDPELERDALAHVLWASHTYQSRLYRLPGRGTVLAAKDTAKTEADSRRRTAIKGSPAKAVVSSLRIDPHRLMPGSTD